MTEVIYMDLNRCIYCRACEVACEREHGGFSHMFVQIIEDRYAVPMNCRHCETSSCTLVCPSQALYRSSPEAVTINVMKCIACKLCTLACPFGVIWPDSYSKVARKCDLCIHRLEKGLEPACVATCSARALSFGELDEILIEAQKIDATTLISRTAGRGGTVVTLPKNDRDGMRKR